MMTVTLETDLRAFPVRHSHPARPSGRQYPRTLADAVEAAVDQVDANCLTPVADAAAGPAFQSRTLLGLLTYCYARQVYSSGEIAAQLGRELRPFWVDEIDVPDAGALHRFRAENRTALVFCLRLALLFLAEEKIREGVVTHVKRAHIHQEANRRVIMAMFTDSLQGPEEKSHRELSFGFGVAVHRGRVH